jgi:tetratricopeptide (TPR) repeat protein
MARLARAAERAVALDPNLAEARASLGNVFKHQWKLEEAEREFRKAIELNPNYASAHQWLGRALMDMGRFDAGIAELQRAAELDPLSARIADNLSDGWLRMGRPNEALAVADRALSLQRESQQAIVFRAMALAHLGRSAEAIQATSRIDRARWSMFVAYVLAVAGDAQGAERELHSSEVKVDVSEQAGAWFALGRKPEGLAALVPTAIKINTGV